MKVAISGKGGVGKSTLSAAIILLLARRGERVLALDSDPDANLAAALGFPSDVREGIVPITKHTEFIEARTEAKTNEYGRIFKLNPEVGDVADKFATRYNGVELLVLGAVNSGGAGCACPANTFARALVTDLVLFKNESLVMDMEAGIEHLGRATASGVDVMVIVAEPGQRSVDCAKAVLRMADEIGIRRTVLVANKVTSTADKQFLRDALPERDFAAFIPYSQTLRSADRDGVSVLDMADAGLLAQFEDIVKELLACQ